jgi:hypothetical protein
MGTHHTPSQAKAPAGNSPPDGFKRVYYLAPAQFAISNVALQRIKVARFHDAVLSTQPLKIPSKLFVPHGSPRIRKTVCRADPASPLHLIVTLRLP